MAGRARARGPGVRDPRAAAALQPRAQRRGAAPAAHAGPPPVGPGLRRPRRRLHRPLRRLQPSSPSPAASATWPGPGSLH